MRIGCCGSMVAPDVDPVGARIVETLGEIGFDYVELSLADLMRLPVAAVEALRRRLDAAGLACEACNNFFPARYRLTGPDADLDAALAYAEAAIERAAEVGAEVAVFGSGPAKMVPADFPRDRAWSQIVRLLSRLGEFASRRGLIVVIEPLNRLECNIVNSAAEGLRLMTDVGHPNVRLLVDAYHLLREQEAPDIIGVAGGAIRHIHVAAGIDRRFPRAVDADIANFFRWLRSTGYAGRCSVEAFTDDFAEDAPRSLALLRELTCPSRQPIDAKA